MAETKHRVLRPRKKLTTEDARRLASKATSGLGRGLGGVGTACRLLGGIARAFNQDHAARLAEGVAADLTTAAQSLGAAAKLVSGEHIEAEYTQVDPPRRPRQDPEPT